MIEQLSLKGNNSKSTYYWFTLAIITLALAGVFSILLVALRTPGLESIFPLKNFFHKGLIVHVDLSVLAWLLSIFAVIVNIRLPNKFSNYSFLAFILSSTGTILIFISPFFKEAEPFMNNYVPIIDNIWFFLGLSLFLAGILLIAIIGILSSDASLYGFIIKTSSFIIVIAYTCFFIASKKIGSYVEHYELTKHDYYELLFWGGGHVLQFLYSNLLLVIWVLFISYCFEIKKLQQNLVKMLFIINFLIALPSPLFYFIYDIDSVDLRNIFTNQMRHGGGIAPFIFLLYFIKLWLSGDIKLKQSGNVCASLLCAIFLFFYGGLLGLFIHGINVVIPAHYHGSIVGITLACMGFSYYFLAKILEIDLKNIKLSIIQPYIYTIGQVLHISGLAWSGGYGALRKTPGVDLPLKAKLGMGLMGAGGLIAVIGGLLFIYIILYNLLINKNNKVQKYE